ncbi:di-heme oxidoredictase family protein [Pararhizobium sp. IMCC21322]|uniref:di-heme oxidoreductase family protein n=1 Tax=Pararhizobium sp. IMCC21322 TaxID=3067903 RepID=UPI002742433D|nr:di-heme oxidoredictase family protein [Pararhizobium sp. IMCC21322]
MWTAFDRFVGPASFLAGLACLLFLQTGLFAEGGSAETVKRTDLSELDLERVIAVSAPTTDFSKGEVFEVNQGGAGTSLKSVNGDAFSHFTATISFEDEQNFKLGNALFRKLWVSSPATTQASDGLGPLFNARACQSCHLKDGRGHPPEGDTDATSMFLRLARPAEVTDEERNSGAFFVGSLQDPTYGGQLQDLAVPGLRAEGNMVISYTERGFVLGDGSVVSLREPVYSVVNLAYGPLHPDTTLSPRIAPPMIGMGLIEAIEAADIRAGADPHDVDRDGISGRVALARDKSSGQILTGRFGWKAENATVRQQSASAFAGDIGISSPDEPRHFGDCTQNQSECWSYTTGVQARLGDTEAPDPVLDLVTFYSENLAVPARRQVEEEQVLKGKELFYSAGCVSCHTPKFVTSRNARHPSHAFQLIWPYSDFLLHDMGDGLADGQPVGVANGREWRTPPLWGIGLTEMVNGHTFFLHDGRARNLTEAVLWHGGEAEAARDTFAEMETTDRDALIAFLESL